MQMKSGSFELVEEIEIDFRAAKKLNNDLVRILNTLIELELETEPGKKIKNSIQDFIEERIQFLESASLAFFQNKE